ncbi:MAG TPA: hypothetical protein VE973_01475 [Candidatus Limnocylindria bacterium]|nr:hypothetical protein [Candidatus Limnocylindria bacterium]
MDKSLTIKIVIIVAAFGGAGLILYFGLFNNANGPVLPPSGQVSGSGAALSQKDILPNGNTLDFNKIINTKRFQFDVINYPVLDPKNEVGIPENDLVLPDQNTIVKTP